jgi:hypothetical protein
MHELALCGAIAEIARRRAGERHVEVIHLRIGELRQVVGSPSSWNAARAGRSAGWVSKSFWSAMRAVHWMSRSWQGRNFW